MSDRFEVFYVPVYFLRVYEPFHNVPVDASLLYITNVDDCAFAQAYFAWNHSYIINLSSKGKMSIRKMFCHPASICNIL